MYLSLAHCLTPKNNPLDPPKAKNNPKIRSKSKVRIEESIENKSCSAIQIEPKNILQCSTIPKISPSLSNFKKIKVVYLYK